MMGDAGSALVIVSLVLAAAASIALAAITLVDLEGLASARAVRAAAVSRAADVAFEVAAGGLCDVPDWTGLAAGTWTSAFFDPSAVTSWGEPVDVPGMTAALQHDSADEGDPAAWRLFLSGPLAAMTPDPPGASTPYLLAWVADDGVGGEGGGVVRVRARALGPDGLRVDREAVLERVAATGAVRVRARWQPK